MSETRDLNENTLIDLDRGGQICAITVEHASVRADIPHFSFEPIPRLTNGQDLRSEECNTPQKVDQGLR